MPEQKSCDMKAFNFTGQILEGGKPDLVKITTYTKVSRLHADGLPVERTMKHKKEKDLPLSKLKNKIWKYEMDVDTLNNGMNTPTSVKGPKNSTQMESFKL